MKGLVELRTFANKKANSFFLELASKKKVLMLLCFFSFYCTPN